MVLNLGVPLVLNVFEGDGADQREACEEDIGLWVGERSESVVVFLAGRVPEVEGDEPPIQAHVL